MKRGRGVAGSPWPWRWVDRSAPIILAMTLSCIGLFADGFDSPLGQALSCLIASTTLLLVLLVFRPSTAFWRHVRWPFLLFGAGLAWLVIMAALRSIMPPDISHTPYAPDLFTAKFLSAVGGLWFLLTGAIVGQRVVERHFAVNLIILFITAFAAKGLALMILSPQNAAGSWMVMENGRFLGLVGNANVTAALCGAGALLSFGAGLPELLTQTPHQFRLGTPGKRYRGLIFVTAFLLNFVALILTASRFAVVATGLSLISLYGHQAYVRQWPLRQTLQRMAIIGAGALVAVLLFSDMLLQRATLVGADALARWTVWTRFIEMADSIPWTGLGPGAFSQANIYFLQNSTASVRQTWIINSPHNILVQLWFAGGLPYLLLMTGGGVLILRDVLRGLDLRQCSSRHMGLLVAGAIIIAVGLIDISLDVPASADIAFLLVGLAWARAKGEEKEAALPGSAS